MLLVAGLGNPGSKHARQRHNIGFLVADEIIRRYRLSLRKGRHHAYVADGNVGGEKVLVIKPRTFMNDSGRAVRSATSFYKLPARNVIVIYDELDLVLGKVRVQSGGGHAGHNGIRSIISHIGPDFRRVRVGIGHPGDRRRVLGHVLSDFSRAETEQLAPVLSAIAEALPMLVAGDNPGFMTRVALLAPPPGRKRDSEIDGSEAAR